MPARPDRFNEHKRFNDEFDRTFNQAKRTIGCATFLMFCAWVAIIAAIVIAIYLAVKNFG